MARRLLNAVASVDVEAKNDSCLFLSNLAYCRSQKDLRCLVHPDGDWLITLSGLPSQETFVSQWSKECDVCLCLCVCFQTSVTKPVRKGARKPGRFMYS